MPPEQLVDVLSIFGRAGVGWFFLGPPNGGVVRERGALILGESRVKH